MLRHLLTLPRKIIASYKNNNYSNKTILDSLVFYFKIATHVDIVINFDIVIKFNIVIKFDIVINVSTL